MSQTRRFAAILVADVRRVRFQNLGIRDQAKSGMTHFHPVKPFAARQAHLPPSTPSQRLKPGRVSEAGRA